MAKRISDESVKKATGKTWSEWFSIMNKAGAKKMEHKTVAELLYKRYGLSLWWSQMVTVQFHRKLKALLPARPLGQERAHREKLSSVADREVLPPVEEAPKE